MSLLKKIIEFFEGIPADEAIAGTLMDVENITEVCHRLRVPPPSKL